MDYEIKELQKYYGHQWNEIHRIAILGDQVIYHFARNENESTTQPWQIRNIFTNEIIKQWHAPVACGGWPSVVGEGRVLFSGQADIPNDPKHQVRISGHGAHWQPAYVVVYNGSNFTYVQIPKTDTLNEFYSLTYNPINKYFYAGETDFNNPSDWSNYKAGGGIWRSKYGYYWERIWQDPHINSTPTDSDINIGRVIQVFYLNGKVYANCDKSTLDGMCNEKPVMNSFYQITPTIEKLFDYDKDVRPFHIPEYVWKDRIWASGLISFDGTEIKDWEGKIPKGQLYPVGIDNEGNLLLRITKEDYSQGGYTIGRVYEINGDIEYIADNWIGPPDHTHAIATKGGAVSSNDKLFLGMWHSEGGSSVYARLDVLNIKGGSEQKLKLDQEDLDKIREIIEETVEEKTDEMKIDMTKYLVKLPIYNFWLDRILNNLDRNMDWFIGIPYIWWHGNTMEEFLEELMDHIDRVDEPLWRLRRYE